MKIWLMAAGASALALSASGTVTAQARQGGTVDYWMSAETVSGMAAMSGAGQSRGGGGMLGAMMSGRASSGPGYMHNLDLRLASPRPAAAPEAEHLPPGGLGAGPSLPLVSPEQARPRPTPNAFGSDDNDGGSHARIVIYWGCGEHARAGQPIEIDLSRLQRGQVPPQLTNMPWRMMTPPSPGASGTFGEWPNARSRVQIPANGSLVGAHTVRGNYTPDIRFTLAQGQDFLAPVRLTSNTPAASGAVPVAWQAIPNATGYLLMAMGARADGTIVIWTSSEVQISQAGGIDYLSETEAARLVQQRVLLSPQTTQCTVPAEVARSVEAASLMMTAFGPEANFSSPARPARAPRGWTPDWTMKLRTRSAYMGMLGRDMEAMMRGEDSAERRPAREQPRRRRSLGDSLRDSLLGR